MTYKQADLIERIKKQREILTSQPDDVVEALTLDSLFAELRSTFFLVPSEPSSNVTYSLSGSVLKPRA